MNPLVNGKALVGGGILTAGYRPGLYLPNRRQWRDQGKLFTWLDVEDMRSDPIIAFGLKILQAPIAGAKWQVHCDNPQVADFVDQQYNRIWQRDLPKILSIFEFGTAGGETVYRLDPNSGWEVDGLRDIHIADLQPTKHDGRVASLSVKSVAGSGGKGGAIPLPSPRWWWIANQPRFGSLYGYSRLAGAWEPWQERTAQKGAKDARRTWYFKNAYRGGTMHHPVGTLEVEPGVYRSCEEYTREIVEKFETGGVLALPNIRDEKGEFIWTFEPPVINGELKDVREYVKDLGDEELTGMGIPTEIIQASEVGSGWSGRSIPLLVFLGSLDPTVAAIIQALDRQVIWHLVRINFGNVAYEVEPVSLVPKNTDPMEGGGQGGEGGGNGGQPQPGQGPPKPGMGPQPLQLSRVRLAAESPWQAYVGKRGGKGWRNSVTGRIVYGGEQPGTQTKAVKGGGKPAATRAERPKVEDVAAKVKSLLGSGGITAEHVKGLADELMHMTVADLGKLKATLGLKASGAKAVLAKKLAEKALANVPRVKIAENPISRREQKELETNKRASDKPVVTEGEPRKAIADPAKAEPQPKPEPKPVAEKGPMSKEAYKAKVWDLLDRQDAASKVFKSTPEGAQKEEAYQKWKALDNEFQRLTPDKSALMDVGYVRGEGWIRRPGVNDDKIDAAAKASDAALNDTYKYGLSQPGSFGEAANKGSAKAALELLDKGEVDIEKLSAAIHEGWAKTARTFDDPVYATKPEKKANRMKLADASYESLPEDEKEKDRVAARAIAESHNHMLSTHEVKTGKKVAMTPEQVEAVKPKVKPEPKPAKSEPKPKAPEAKALPTAKPTETPHQESAVSEGRIAVTHPTEVGHKITSAIKAVDRTGDGDAPTDQLYHELKRSIAPTLTDQQYTGLLTHLWDSGQLQLKVLNEVRKASPEWQKLSIQRGDNFYGFALPGRGATPESIGKAAQQYLQRHGIETSEEDYNPYGPGYDKHGNKLA